MRKLSFVKLVKSNYDPKNKTAAYNKAVDHYSSDEGYTLEHHVHCVRVVHESNPVPLILSHDKVEYALELPELAPELPELAPVKPEPIAPTKTAAPVAPAQPKGRAK